MQLPTNSLHAPRSALLMATVCVCLSGGLLSGCSNTSSFMFPGVYRIDVAQGNIITQKQVDQLRPGLSKRQVTFILGTPLVRDTFNQNRWDYLYSFQHGGGDRAQERLTVFFENDKLVKLGGDFQQTPENMQFPGSAAAPAAAAATPTKKN